MSTTPCTVVVATVAWFALRNLLWLLGLPVALGGIAVYTIPYWIPITMVKLTRPEVDTEATVKVLTLLSYHLFEKRFLALKLRYEAPKV